MPAPLTDARGRAVTRVQSGDLVRYSLTDGELAVSVEYWLGQTASSLEESDRLALDTLALALPDLVPVGARRAERLARDGG